MSNCSERPCATHSRKLSFDPCGTSRALHVPKPTPLALEPLSRMSVAKRLSARGWLSRLVLLCGHACACAVLSMQLHVRTLDDGCM